VSRFLAGEVKGFEDLYHKYRERVFAVLCRTLGDRDDALEGTQEVFIRVHQALGRYDPRARFFTWVYRIAMNHAIDRIRRRKVRREQVYDETFTEPARDQPTERFQRAGVALEADEVRERVAAAVASLGEKHRSVFVLFSYEGLGYAEIAEALDIPIGTVMSRLYHARRKVREMLPPDWDPGGPERTRESRPKEDRDES
jgi:RNA polymerase sigma-70 factor (ECF subfamily)